MNLLKIKGYFIIVISLKNEMFFKWSMTIKLIKYIALYHLIVRHVCLII